MTDKQLLKRVLTLVVMLGIAWMGWAQDAGANAPVKITKVTITVLGQSPITEQFVRGQIRLKVGDTFSAVRTNSDVVNLMRTGRFSSVEIKRSDFDGGVELTYEVTGYPQLASVLLYKEVEQPLADGTFTNVVREAGLRIKEEKLLKQIQLSSGVQYNEAKRHSDEAALREYYIKKGYHPVRIRSEYSSDDLEVKYFIHEGERVKIDQMEIKRADGVELSFEVGELDNYVKTRERRRWYNPVTWITNDGRIKEDQVDDDVERLTTFYRNRGFLDARVDVVHDADNRVLRHPDYFTLRDAMSDAAEKVKATENLLRLEERKGDNMDEDLYDQLEDRLDDEEDALDDAEDALDDFLDDHRLVTLTFNVTEGARYQIGDVTFKFLKEVTNADGQKQRVLQETPVFSEEELLEMMLNTSGEMYNPGELDIGKDSDVAQIKNAYGRKAYVNAEVRVDKVARVEDNTIDLEITIFEGNSYYVDFIEIEGNEKTQDFVIRRELLIAPGEPFDLGRVELSKTRLETMQIFESVNTGDVPATSGADDDRVRNLLVSVKETGTGRFMVGGGFSTDYGAFGHVMVAQENFDISRWRKPHMLQGAGQKIRVRAQVGGRFNNSTVDFVEPWFMGQKLRFTTSLYQREMQYYSDRFDVEETGVSLSLERPLMGDERLTGRVSLTVEDTGLVDVSSAASTQLRNEAGTDLIGQLGVGLAFDTRGGGNLPTKGQRTSLDLDVAPDYLGSEKEFYTLHLKTIWYFGGFYEGHVIEVKGQAAMAETLSGGGTVPYLYRFGLGGGRNLRGFEYYEVGPRGDAGDYLGGNTMLHGTLEYSVPTPFKMMRLATFYDWGVVNTDAFDFGASNYNDNWGVGARLDIPFLGPLRLDYGIPITTDGNNGGGGFNINFGYTTTF